MHSDCIIIGAGHSGLAMSHCLSECGVEHVILERGEIANSWKHERWDSLRLLTPNWQVSLPGHAYRGNDPQGFMTMPEVIDFIEAYAAVISAEVKQNTEVRAVTFDGAMYHLETSQGFWQSETLVLASGACNIPTVPVFADRVPSTVAQITPSQYRNPRQIDEGGVLVVGASATGLQLAEEIHRSGRPVTLAVGEHVRMPRHYRGRDIQWWLDKLGVLDEAYDEIDDLARGRNLPSPQLVGTSEFQVLDLNRLTSLGVNLRGRLVGIQGGKAQFSGSLRNNCELADLKMQRLLARIDAFIEENRPNDATLEKETFEPTRVETSPPLLLDFDDEQIRSILWATGYRADHSWLKVPVFDHKGRIRHDGGIVDSPGMVLMGAPLLRRRKSSFIHGAQDDARELSTHIHDYLQYLRKQACNCVGF